MGIKEAEEPNVEGRLPLLPYLPQTFLKCSRSPSSKVRFFESPQEKNALSFAIPSCAFLNRNRPRQSIFSGKLANHVRNHFQFRPILPRKKQLFHAVLNLEVPRDKFLFYSKEGEFKGERGSRSLSSWITTVHDGKLRKDRAKQKRQTRRGG